jgi:Copper resistance protein D
VSGTPDLLLAALHWLEYLGLLGVIGSAVVWRLGRLTPSIEWARPPFWIAVGAALGGVAGLLLVEPSSVISRPDLAAAAHVLSAGMWAGGILALAALRPPGGWKSAEARDLVERFGRVALIAFAITALTGVLRATDRLHDVSDLWASAYGVVLLIKCAGVVAMLVLSVAWRRGSPLAQADAGLTVAVVGASALLAAFPMQA